MPLFNEHFPVDKSSIVRYVERQKVLEEIAAKLKVKDDKIEVQKSSDNEIKNQRKSMMDEIVKMKHEVENDLRASKERDEKIEKIHEMIEKVDEIVVEPEQEKEVIEEKKEDEEDEDEPRVYQFEDNFQETSTYKVPKIKPTKSSLLKLKFTKEKSLISKSSQCLLKPLSTDKPKSSLSSVKSLPFKFEKPKSNKQNLDKSIRKILDDAKEKHASIKQQKSSAISVINMELF